MDDIQLMKLPKYARDEIHRLRADLALAKRQLFEMGNPDALIVFDDWPGGKRVGLGTRETVTFKIGDAGESSKIEAEIRDGHLLLRGSGQSQCELVIAPIIHNQVKIGLKRL